jgi:hypothetical protein
LLGYDIGGALFLKAQLRVGVQVAPDSGNGGCVGQDFVDQFHASIPVIR